MKEDEFIAPDATVRKTYYGAGRQPWDDIVDAGWGPAFAAGNALKYVRRYANKNGNDDLKKGRWYYAQLFKFSTSWREPTKPIDEAGRVIARLLLLLTSEEISLLRSNRTLMENVDEQC